MYKKTIWFINDYAGSPYHGMEFRNYYIAKELVKLGHKVYIVSASYMHLFKTLPKTTGEYTFENIDGIEYIWVDVPHYKSSTDKKRVLKWFVFVKKLFSLPLEKMRKPDIIVASPMAPFLIFPSYWFAKKFKVKLFYEVKDIWPLSLMELGGFSKYNPIIALMSFSERFAIKKSDTIVSSLQNYGEHIKKDLGLERDFEWICNGIDLQELENSQPLDKEVAQKIPHDKFIVGYTGTIGIANAMDSFCEAAKLLVGNKEILFVIVGDGKEKKSLVKKYDSLDNILFIDSIPKQQVQSMLKLFDVCYIGLKQENLFKYGVSPNKLFDYMYSAKPILYAINSGKNNIVKTADCGISVEAEDSESTKEGILNLYFKDKEARKRLGNSGKKYVLENFNYKALAQKYINLIG